ncbi:protein Bop [Ochotona curzoniae]|uniref:protein Bop n=1 Tax=Ochotona curzoniae TaxID=130825 RepID=UPI001B353E05|nr:protein Bop [Ochotona curzoniae]XP_040859691.1 protein Bop [Ochotona curzoniae]
MSHGQPQRQGPPIPIQAAANYANAHPWEQMDPASGAVAYAPMVDPWIERPCCGDPVCVRTTMEQKSPDSSAPDQKPPERVPLAVRVPRPLRVDFHWVPGSDPGTFDGSPWLLDRFLAQLGDYMSFRFDHYQDQLSRVCEILGRLTGRARAWAAPYLDGQLPLPNDYELFCQELEGIVHDPENIAAFRAAMPCSLPPASSQPPVAPQLPVVRQYLARFAEALALNMGTPPRPVPAAPATPAGPRPESTPRNAKQNIPGPTETPAPASSAGSPGPVGAAAPQPEGVALEAACPILSESVKPLAQKEDLACAGAPEPQKTEEGVTETQGCQEVSSDAPQGVLETPGEPVPCSTSLGSQPDPDSCDEAACASREPHDPHLGHSDLPTGPRDLKEG